MAKNQICKKDTDKLPKGVVFNFANDTSVEVSPDMFPEDMQVQLMKYGISQKFGDSYAGASSVEEAIEVFNGVLEQVKTGDWKTKSAGGAVRTTLLTAALCAVTGKSEEEANTVIAGLDEAGKKDLRDHPQIAAEIAKISAERAVAKAKAAAEAAKTSAPLELL